MIQHVQLRFSRRRPTQPETYKADMATTEVTWPIVSVTMLPLKKRSQVPSKESRKVCCHIHFDNSGSTIVDGPPTLADGSNAHGPSHNGSSHDGKLGMNRLTGDTHACELSLEDLLLLLKAFKLVMQHLGS